MKVGLEWQRELVGVQGRAKHCGWLWSCAWLQEVAVIPPV